MPVHILLPYHFRLPTVLFISLVQPVLGMIYLLYCCDSSFKEVGATHFEGDGAVCDLGAQSLDTRVAMTLVSARPVM